MTKVRLLSSLAALLLLSWVAYWVFFSGDVFATHASNEKNRMAMGRIEANLTRGADYDKVLRTFWRESFGSKVRLNVQSKDVWFATMPSEFGGGDWVLQIHFRAGVLTETKLLDSNGQPAVNDVTVLL